MNLYFGMRGFWLMVEFGLWAREGWNKVRERGRERGRREEWEEIEESTMEGVVDNGGSWWLCWLSVARLFIDLRSRWWGTQEENENIQTIRSSKRKD